MLDGVGSLSSTETPRGWDREKKEGALGTTGRRKGEDVSFTLSPASKLPTRPSAKEASAEERGVGSSLKMVGGVLLHPRSLPQEQTLLLWRF